MKCYKRLMHKQLFQVPGLCWLNVSRDEKVNDFNPKWKALYKQKITQFNAEGVLRIFSQDHENVLSSASVSLSWRKSNPEKECESGIWKTFKSLFVLRWTTSLNIVLTSPQRKHYAEQRVLRFCFYFYAWHFLRGPFSNLAISTCNVASTAVKTLLI